MSNGLPILPSSVTVFTSGALLASDVLSAISSAIFGSQWGIFFGGFPVVLADNVLNMGRSKDSRIAKYPQEPGDSGGASFASYNKVNMPFTIKLRFSAGGSVANRRAIIKSVEAIEDDTNLYEIITPEETYPSCNVIHSDYNRAAMNVGLLEMDVWVEQVRIAGALQFSNTQSPAGASTQNGGLVQPMLTGRIRDTSNGPDPTFAPT